MASENQWDGWLGPYWDEFTDEQIDRFEALADNIMEEEPEDEEDRIEGMLLGLVWYIAEPVVSTQHKADMEEAKKAAKESKAARKAVAAVVTRLEQQLPEAELLARKSGDLVLPLDQALNYLMMLERKHAREYLSAEGTIDGAILAARADDMLSEEIAEQMGVSIKRVEKLLTR